jgi:hypothetical protein
MYLDGIFDLIDIIKNRFRKKFPDEELDEYLDSEMPGELKPQPRGVISEEQENRIRRAGL